MSSSTPEGGNKSSAESAPPTPFQRVTGVGFSSLQIFLGGNAMATQSITIPAKGGRPARHLTGIEAETMGLFMVIFGLATLVFSLWPSEQTASKRTYHT